MPRLTDCSPRRAGIRRCGSWSATPQRQFVVGPRLCAARQCRRVSRSDFFFRCHHRFQIGQPGGGSGAAPARRREGRLGAANSPCRLKQGVDTFRAFVESWYRGGLQRIIFDPVPRAGYSPHDRGDPGGLRLGPKQSLCARNPAAFGGVGGTMLPGLSRALCCAGACGCICSAAPAAPRQPARLGLKLAPATLGASLSLQQHLTRRATRPHRRARCRAGN